jgi:Uma2 family endonuclease
MATALAPVPHAEDRNVLREITWETYVRLCDENNSRTTQMAYFEGELEIMTVGWPHETAKDRVSSLFMLTAESLGVDFEGSGQHTFRHNRKRIGFEADLSYYTTNLDRVRGRTEINLDKDPPPDLVVEIDISRNSERKLLMYAALGIREVWRYEGAAIRIYRLHGKEYKTSAKSSILRGVAAKQLTKLLADSERMNRLAWFALIRKSIARA